jgi:hypothetical protein
MILCPVLIVFVDFGLAKGLSLQQSLGQQIANPQITNSQITADCKSAQSVTFVESPQI